MSMDSIKKFTDRVSGAVKSKSKEIRLTIDEAQDLMVSVMQIVGGNAELQTKIITLQQEIIKNKNKETENTEVIIRGGKLKNDN